LDLLLSESPPVNKKKNKRKTGNSTQSAQHLQQQYFQFGPRQANLLTNVLTHTQLPGLSSVDQMHLLALADTLASCDSNHLVGGSLAGGVMKGSYKDGTFHIHLVLLSFCKLKVLFL